jgi:hypothetical protein
MPNPARSDLRGDYDQILRQGQDRLSTEENCIKSSNAFNYVGVQDPSGNEKGANTGVIKVSEQGDVYIFDMSYCIEKGVNGWILLGSIGSTSKNGIEIHKENNKICLYGKNEYGISVSCFEKDHTN